MNFMTKRIISFLVAILVTAMLLTSTSQPVEAFSFQEIFDRVKSIFSEKEDVRILKKELVIEPAITLVSDGDKNKNGEIDAGDVVRFIYKLTNTTEKDISLGTLNTHINRKQFNFIHNIQGTTNISDNGTSLEILNLNIYAGETLEISFDARTINTKDDISISTEPVLNDSDKKLVTKASKIEKLVKNQLPEFQNGLKVEKK